MDREQRRAQILAIAATVFAEKGYHDAKIEDIVARARVARGTFYLYFEDKRAIFEELVSGFVRPVDISRQNEVNYDKIAAARISYGGRGQITEAQNARWGQQALDHALPF